MCLDSLRQPALKDVEQSLDPMNDTDMTEKKRKLISTVVGTMSGIELDKLERIITGCIQQVKLKNLFGVSAISRRET